jgi:hypothetical protein
MDTAMGYHKIKLCEKDSDQTAFRTKQSHWANKRLLFGLKTTQLVQLLCFWTLSIILSLSKKHRPVYFSKHNVSETGFCLCLQVKPTQLGPIDRTSPYLRTSLYTMGKKDPDVLFS